MMRKLLAALPLIAILFSACSTNNVTEDNSLGRFFDSAGVKGCFALYDNGQGRFTIYNLPRYRDTAYPAGATFDILQSLIALQTGTLSNEKSPFAQLSDTSAAKSTISLQEAFTSRNGPLNLAAFQTLTKNIGKDTLRKWVDSVHYGNQDIGGPLDSCWFDGHLRIPADQQLGLIKKLYFNQLPFFNRTQEIVRDIMTRESNTNYKLVYKTALVPNGSHYLGWALGWVEENKHPYFFAMNYDLPAPPANTDDIGIQIVKHILPSMGFFDGKK